MCEVLNARNVGNYTDGAIYIGRPSKFGNPYSIGVDGNRTQVIKLFKEHFYSDEKLQIDAKKELTGKNLICWCAPLACHGDIYLEFLATQ